MEKSRARRIWVRVSDNEYEHLRQNAAAHGCSMSEHIRRTAICGEQLAPVNIDMEPLRRMLLHMQRLGGNVNQIAHAANTFGVAQRDMERISRALGEVAEIRDEHRRLVDDLREGRLSL